MTGGTTVGEAVGAALASYGPARCFGVLGSSNFKLTHAMAANGIAYVATRHEAGAITMADAHARITGELTFVSLHSGPGLTNAATGLAEAAKSGTPLLVVAGDTSNGGLLSNFHMDQEGLVRSVGAVAERIHSPATALADVARAMDTAVRLRRTVVLNVPLDVQLAPLPEGAVLSPLPPVVGALRPEGEAVSRLADMLLSACRPVLLAGRGALIARAGDALVALGARTGAVLATTACAHGLFEGEEWNVGISGGFSSPAAARIIAASDLIVGFGATFTRWTTHGGQLVGAETALVQVDVDAARLGMQRPVSLGVQADARLTAEALCDEIDGRGEAVVPDGWRTDDTRRLLREQANNAAPYDDFSRDDAIDPRTVTKALDDILPMERVVVTDAGHSMGWPARHLRVPDAQGWCFTQSFQSIGLGLATAIGCAVARPDRLVVAGIGDGGLMMSLAELETAVRLGLRICILVYDDAAYLAEVHRYKPAGYDTSLVEFPDFDFAAAARGIGARGVVVRTLEDLRPVREWVAEGAPGVFVVDAKITAELFADWIQSLLATGKHN